MFVFHDIDGVSHAEMTRPPRPGDAGWSGEWLPMTLPGAYPGYISLEMVGEYNLITATPGLTNLWLTNWEEEAVELYAPLTGIRGADWDVLKGSDQDASWDWWKFKVLREFMAAHPGEPFIWLDDHISTDSRALRWLNSLPVQPLIICPKTSVGITRAHLGFMDAYVRRHLGAGLLVTSAG